LSGIQKRGAYFKGEHRTMPDLKGTSLTWLGHATVLVVTPKGTTILIDPFLEHNPSFPKDYKLPEKIDLILATHGHSDHIADVVPVAKKTGAPVVGMVELVGWFQSKGLEKLIGMNMGGSYTQGEVTVTMIEAKHSSGIQDGDKIIYGGEPAGFVIAIEGGPVLLHAGDTTVFSDMKLIAELYKPELGMLPIGGKYTMGPREAAMAAKYLELKSVLPIHFGTMPELAGTPEELEQHLGDIGIEVIKVRPGHPLT
jgi:L-ascorbate metabolism protein UlaG (beta-lactamase superfamily)